MQDEDDRWALARWRHGAAFMGGGDLLVSSIRTHERGRGLARGREMFHGLEKIIEEALLTARRLKRRVVDASEDFGSEM